MLPSERQRAAGKARVHSHSVRVWVCRGCGFVSDCDPIHFQIAFVDGRLYGPKLCPKCGAEGLWRETRRKD
jgi:hypothetical protein